MEDRTPREIVEELDRYVVGQDSAKKAMAIALRNRYRRRLLPPEVRDDVTPKNILMIGATGVGKTEIARRVAGLSGAPFIKVEATRFTEVGYVGRDVDSIIQELVEASVNLLYDQKLQEVQEQAERRADERIVDYVCQQVQLGRKRKASRRLQVEATASGGRQQAMASEGAKEEQQGPSLPDSGGPEQPFVGRERSRVKKLLNSQRLDDAIIEIEVSQDTDNYESVWEFSTGMSQEEVSEGLKEFIDNYTSSRKKSRKVSVRDARRILTREEATKLVDYDGVVEQAVQRAEQNGIVFIDEIDKIVGGGADTGSDISGEGVQRDLLPIIEGSNVMTRYGTVKTDHVLFIAAGSFTRARPSDLIPELQGRFPLRVELKSLALQEMKQILTQPKNALVKQYAALLSTEGVDLQFSDDGIAELAETACRMNRQLEDIGARRLQTVMEYVLEDISFRAPGLKGQSVVVDSRYVRERVAGVVADEDLSRYIL